LPDKLAKNFLFSITLPSLSKPRSGVSFKGFMPKSSPTMLGTLFFNILKVSLSISKSGNILSIAFETSLVTPSLFAKTIFFLVFCLSTVSSAVCSDVCLSSLLPTVSSCIDCIILPNLGSFL
jgi:hypothetical protein